MQARTLYGVDLDTLKYAKLDGVDSVEPKADLSGLQYELDQKEKAEKAKSESS
jgi:hypothetical protein